MKSFKNLIIGTTISAALLFSMTAMAVKPEDRTTLVGKAIELNTSGPYAGVFSTLIAVLLGDVAYDAEGSLVETLSGNGQYTVFAPTNGAFDTLFTVAECNGIDLTTEPELVRSVLEYHVAKGRRDSTDVAGSTQIRTLMGARFYVDYQFPSVFLNDIAGQTATVIVADQEADNGIIHAIDTVILPVSIDLAACEDQ
jgi:uncharacterized surface protein with fasciclin (FAS1) repeats